eukprot:SAG31_NODE_367_length_16811_cov_20.811584_6_plen_69_part_00
MITQDLAHFHAYKLTSMLQIRWYVPPPTTLLPHEQRGCEVVESVHAVRVDALATILGDASLAYETTNR